MHVKLLGQMPYGAYMTYSDQSSCAKPPHINIQITAEIAVIEVDL